MTEHTVTKQTETTQAEMLVRVEALEAELVRLKAQVGSAWGGAAGADSDAGSHRLAAPEASSSRRDLLRYGAVALGAAAAGLAVRPAEAANGDPVLIGSVLNQGTQDTWVMSSGVGVSALLGWASNSSGAGTGVEGYSDASNGKGVFGTGAAASGFSVGVWGAANSPGGIGVEGINYVGGVGVRGEIPGAATASSGIAVYGLNLSTYAGPNAGGGGFGAYGFSQKGHGLVGATGTAGGAAVAGATNGVAGAYAGVFYGPVVVTGTFTVLGAKSAAVPHPDGSHRRLYCVESPESWFEDFGKGQLECGRAEVVLDPDFAALADMTDYHVFVTAYDQPHDLIVSERTSRGFHVTAKDESSSGAFSWRLVAKRKDIEGERLATVTIPPAPQLPEVPSTTDRANDRRTTIPTPTGR